MSFELFVEASGRTGRTNDGDDDRPLTKKQRAALERRLDRLDDKLAKSVGEATALVEGLVTDASEHVDALRLRHGFVRMKTPGAGVDISDRSAPDLKYRPASTRLMSPNGIALPFSLITILEAQSRTLPGKKAAPTPLMLRRETSEDIGWTDLIASGATPSGDGRHRMGVLDKKQRQVQTTLDRLVAERLVELAGGPRTRNRYEHFRLMRDDARRDLVNDYYRTPEDPAEYFTVPFELFTNLWIYVLEDSELALLLIAARMHHQGGEVVQRMPAGTRLLHYGLSRDAFAAHQMLDRLGLLRVDSDPQRHDGRVTDYATRGAQPHGLLFLPEGLRKPALPTLITAINAWLDEA